MDKTGEMSSRPSAREAIMDAFRDIILTGGYENVRVLDVVERSRVARSTFYEHFQSREDLLQESLREVFQLLAPLAAPSCDMARIAVTLDHIAGNRALLKSLIRSPGMQTLVDVFSEVIEADTSTGPIAAQAIAAAQLAVLSAWLDRKVARDAAGLAALLREIALALLQTDRKPL